MKHKINRQILLYLLSVILCSVYSYAETDPTAAFGKVLDQRSNKYMPGVKCVNLENGSITYSLMNGEFRFPADTGLTRIKFTFPGYRDTVAVYDMANSSFELAMQQKFVHPDSMYSGIQDPYKIIKKTRANLLDRKVKTFKGANYSKLNLHLQGTDWGVLRNIGTGIKIAPPKKAIFRDLDRVFVRESFSEDYYDLERGIDKRIIKKQRKTADFDAEEHLFQMLDFLTITPDNINFMSLTILSPFAEDASEHYSFVLKNVLEYNDDFIYEIVIQSNDDIYPTVEGSVKIEGKDFNIIEINIKPAGFTKIPLLEEVVFYQRYEEYEPEIWHWAFLEVTSKIKVQMLYKYVDVTTDAHAVSIYDAVTINEELPPFMYDEEELERPDFNLDYLPDADSVGLDFWHRYARTEIELRELTAKLNRDSLDSFDLWKYSPSRLKGNIKPYFDFNRVNALALGLTPIFQYRNYELKFNGNYSFGQKLPYGYMQFTDYLYHSKYKSFYFDFKTYSDVSIMINNGYNRFANSLIALFFHRDFFDYYRNDGWTFGLNYEKPFFEVRGEVNYSIHSSLGKSTDRSLLLHGDYVHGDPWLENTACDPGHYRIAKVKAKFGKFDFINFTRGISTNAEVEAMYGENTGSGEAFRSLQARFFMSVPTFNTGYSSQKFELLIHHGIGSNNLPIQYQFRMRTDMFIFSQFGNFVSSPRTTFSSKAFQTYHLRYNFTDHWWRALGLPLIEGRGLDLILAASVGQFYQNSDIKIWQTFGNIDNLKDGYSEVGVSLGRIPILISNVVFLTFDTRWGVGRQAAGRFNWAVSVSWPM